MISLKKQKKESEATELNDALIIRACMLKYKDMMYKTYGQNTLKIIPTISIQQLIQDNYKQFISTVIELGMKTAKYIRTKLTIPEDLIKNKLHNPNLSIKHITALVDYIDEHTIVDIKTTPNIEMSHIRQVLAYHYLSTKRSDLNINEVIVYNPVIDKAVEILIKK